MDVTTGTASAHNIAARDATTITQMATAGVPCRASTFLSAPLNGVPLSRASEYSARDADVMLDSPQNHMAIDAIADMALPARAPSAVAKMAMTAGTGLPPASFAASTSGIERTARVRAITSRYPTTPETATESTMPHGAR